MAYVVAAQAAAAQQQMLLLEEERMTPYTSDDLSNDWEFKIVRANTRAFRNPETLRTLIQEESRGGWVMLEKFDDSRVRFKRPRSAGANDAQVLSSGVDPYRTHYGMSPATYTVLLVAAILGFTFLVLACIFGVMALVRPGPTFR